MVCSRQFFCADEYSIIYSFDDIIAFELLEDGISIIKDSVDAIVGGKTRNIKTKKKSICSNLQIKITVNDFKMPIVYVNLISEKTKTDGFVYKSAYNLAQNILTLLKIICAGNSQKEEKTVKYGLNIGSADEIFKYKGLLDQGIITQDEFNIRKKQLLGM